MQKNIQVLEVQALVMSLRRVALSLHGRDVRQVLIVDNVGVCFSFDRYRSTNFELLNQIRVFASNVFARNLKPTVRWVPPEFHSSDEPRRRCHPFPSVSHLLMHEFDRAGESEKECGTRDMDTDAKDVGNTAGNVNVFCQPVNFDSHLHQNDSGQFDQTVFQFRL